MESVRTGPRVHAPELTAGDWLNTPNPLRLHDLRGRFVLLDFWTSCCGNCLHVLDELRPLEHDFADVLTVIGVHSPKFPHEADTATVRAAVARYDVAHPVVSDPQLRLWRQYAVRAWPTLVLIDPEGYVVAQAAGEGQVSALGAVIDRVAPEYRARGTLGPAGDSAPPSGDSADTTSPPDGLRYPASAIVLPAERTGRSADSLLVADAGHHSIVETTADGTVLRRIGTGRRGEPFAEPNGLSLLPPGLMDYDVLVADTANHVLRGVRLSDGAIVTTVDLPSALAGQATVTGPIPPVLSPWDVAWWPALDRAVVAAAGVHLLLSVDPRTGSTEVLTGTTVEGLRDGPGADAWLAQPSGLAVDGEVLWFVDAETSALRRIDTAGRVTTVVGEGLFDFGHVDGPAGAARFQHPLGVAVLPDAGIAVLDTYNGAVRRYDPATDTVTTLADGLAEPSGAVVIDGRVLVVESAAHRLVALEPREHRRAGAAMRVERPPTDLHAGDVRLTIDFTPAPGRTLDDRDGPATLLGVTASPPELLTDGAGEGTDLHRTITLAAGTGVLHVTARAASCDSDPAVEHPACHLARQDWGIPVRVGTAGGTELRLPLLG